MESIWTIAGDETSWPEWADRMANAPASDLVEGMIAGLNPGGQRYALDIGCGAGRAFAPLARRGYRVVGIDPVEAAAQLSRQRAARDGLDAGVLMASAGELPLAVGSMQAVIAVGVLFHLVRGELGVALREIRRVLTADGEAILHFLDIADWRQTLGEELRPDEGIAASYKYVVTSFHPESMLRQLIRSAGLDVRDHRVVRDNDDAGQRVEWFFQCGLPEYDGLRENP